MVLMKSEILRTLTWISWWPLQIRLLAWAHSRRQVWTVLKPPTQPALTAPERSRLSERKRLTNPSHIPSGSLGEEWALLARGSVRKSESAQWPVEDVLCPRWAANTFELHAVYLKYFEKKANSSHVMGCYTQFKIIFSDNGNAHNIVFTWENTYNLLQSEKNQDIKLCV